VEGTVDGDLFGEQRIIVRSSSQLKGNLLANRVSLEDGAKFKGSVDMDIDSRKHVFNASRETAAKGEKNKLTEKAAPQA
ncbi:MAG: polymer-forming cytoskeletal protein, partial [Cellvibrionaceae bacterium]|nr:polymer-forming cytoskeletal protein [Cellvibrionaceae bacterium]